MQDVLAWFDLDKKQTLIMVESQLTPQVSCTIPNVGAAGEGQFHNGLCVLSQVRFWEEMIWTFFFLQNIVNEKIYLAVWFWYAFLVPYAILAMFFRLFTIFFDKIRFNLIYKTVKFWILELKDEIVLFRSGTNTTRTSENVCSMCWPRDRCQSL